MKSLAIITARGGSKRIPHKNIKRFNGRPIIAYSIETAINSGCFEEIMVSTDSEEIADTAKKYGASVPFLRSKETSSDYATTADVLEEVLNKYQNMGKHYDTACCIYPTAPLLRPDGLKNAMRILQNDLLVDTVISVVPYSYPPQRGVVIQNRRLHMWHPENTDKRSQDLAVVYHDAGQFYFFRTESFLNSHNLWEGNVAPYILSGLEVQDIDNTEDWILAEIKYQYMKIREGGKDGYQDM